MNAASRDSQKKSVSAVHLGKTETRFGRLDDYPSSRREDLEKFQWIQLNPDIVMARHLDDFESKDMQLELKSKEKEVNRLEHCRVQCIKGASSRS